DPLPLRVNLNQARTGLELLRMIKDETVQAFAHEAPIRLALPCETHFESPLGRLLVNFLPFGGSSLPLQGLTKSGLTVGRGPRCKFTREHARSDLVVRADQTERGLVVVYVARETLFEKERIERLAIDVRALMTAILVRPNDRLDNLRKLV